MNSATLNSLTVSVLLALLGIAGKYWNDLRIARRKDRLERVNQQLRELYGPLSALVEAGSMAWGAFRTRHRPGVNYFSDGNPTSQEDLGAWRLWMLEVFMPLNLRLESLILDHADLVDESEMPEGFRLLIAHVTSYKPVLKGWADGNFSEHLSVIPFPRVQLEAHVSTTYGRLKREQGMLLGHRA